MNLWWFFKPLFFSGFGVTKLSPKWFYDWMDGASSLTSPVALSVLMSTTMFAVTFKDFSSCSLRFWELDNFLSSLSIFCVYRGLEFLRLSVCEFNGLRFFGVICWLSPFLCLGLFAAIEFLKPLMFSLVTDFFLVMALFGLPSAVNANLSLLSFFSMFLL